MGRKCIECGHRDQSTKHGLCETCADEWRQRAGRVTDEQEEGGQVTLSDF